MSRFAIKTPYLIVVICAIVAILGAVSVVQMPVDMFPSMNIPVVVVATFYAGMPPEQIEATSPITWNDSSLSPAASTISSRDRSMA
jgi:multidrug efflux pump subunit AcrB